MIRLKELREKRGVEQEELAVALHVSQPTISNWESGKRMPSTENVLRLADYFHVSIEYLLGRCANDFAYQEERIRKMITEMGIGEKELYAVLGFNWTRFFEEERDSA